MHNLCCYYGLPVQDDKCGTNIHLFLLINLEKFADFIKAENANTNKTRILRKN